MRKSSEQQAREWADRSWDSYRDEAGEPVYPDGSVRHECWNPSALRQQQKTVQKEETAKKDRMSEDTRSECF